MWKVLALLALAVFAIPKAEAVSLDCGQVTIINFLVGPRHGSMMRVSNSSCGQGDGWVCLDPGFQYISQEQSKRMFAYLFAQYLSGNSIRLTVRDGVYATECNFNAPVIDDARAN